MLMFLNNNMFSKNYGMAGAISTVLFILCAILCLLIYSSMTKTDNTVEKARKRGRF
jgi:multiple sugar transport system permease protein